MRIIIDLQAYQSKDPDGQGEILALVKSLVETAETHEVWVALNHHFSNTINSLRETFKELLPRDRVVVFDIPELPAPQTTSFAWTCKAAEKIRAGFLASLNPDLVFAPYLFDVDDHHVINAISPHIDRYKTIVMVGDTTIPELAIHDENFYRRKRNLMNAAKIITKSETVAKNLRITFENEMEDILVATDVRTIWAAFSEIFSTPNLAKTANHRSKLAFVSPLPPMKTGIADYSVELLHELIAYYDIELIVDQPTVSIPWIQANFNIRNLEWFEAHADEYDHVLYHIGNSSLHQHMFNLLKHHPGVVVLHDFFISNVLEDIDYNGYAPGVFSRALYQSHGLSGLISQKKMGHTESIWTFPCNRGVLENATGIIVHSKYSEVLASNWYGRRNAAHWRNIPLIRGHHGSKVDRKTARTKLGLADTDFIVCSFGMMLTTKCNDILLDAWFESLLALDSRCLLIFVGENNNGEYGEQILRKITQHQAGEKIFITGFVSQENYDDYLAAADIAVQLRTRSRGETSASILDCLLHGLPTIVNSHGSAGELPDEVLMKIEDKFSLEQLRDALNKLWEDSNLRKKLSLAARQYIEKHHAPSYVGQLYHEAIEYFYRNSPKQHYLNLIKSISSIGMPSQHDLKLTAAAIASNQPPSEIHQLFIDISVLVQMDHRTGIQRVVRSILSALLDNPPSGYRIEPVYSPGGGESYRYAHRHVEEWLQLPIPTISDEIIEIRAGDIFLGLDLFLSGTQQNAALLQQYKNKGVYIYFVVYDILPVLRPDVFPEGTDLDFSGWLHMIARLSHGLVCISEAVADELSDWIETHCPQQKKNLTIDYFHLGADINASQPSIGLTSNAVEVLELVRSRPSLLMVGTLEPRKGHAQALAAFDLLWSEGVDVNLVIVGKNGWMMEELATRLQSHPEHGKHLLWPQNVSDEMLLQLYEASSGLLAASEGEGFGLPLIEAAQHKLPIVARKLPVFVEVMGEYAYYFDGLKADTLADTIRTWLHLLYENKAPQSDGMRWLTWEESAQQLLSSVLQHHRVD